MLNIAYIITASLEKNFIDFKLNLTLVKTIGDEVSIKTKNQ